MRIFCCKCSSYRTTTTGDIFIYRDRNFKVAIIDCIPVYCGPRKIRSWVVNNDWLPGVLTVSNRTKIVEIFEVVFTAYCNIRWALNKGRQFILDFDFHHTGVCIFCSVPNSEYHSHRISDVFTTEFNKVSKVWLILTARLSLVHPSHIKMYDFTIVHAPVVKSLGKCLGCTVCTQRYHCMLVTNRRRRHFILNIYFRCTLCRVAACVGDAIYQPSSSKGEVRDIIQAVRIPYCRDSSSDARVAKLICQFVKDFVVPVITIVQYRGRWSKCRCCTCPYISTHSICRRTDHDWRCVIYHFNYLSDFIWVRRECRCAYR